MATVRALAICWGLPLLYFSQPVGLYMLFITEPYFASMGVVTALVRPFTFTACLSKHSLITFHEKRQKRFTNFVITMYM